MPDPKSFKTDTKTTTQAFGRDIRNAFCDVRVDRAKLEIAARALRWARPGVFNYRLANDEFKGVKMENIDAAADLICQKLGLIDR